MRTGFRLFGVAHLMIIAAVPALAWLLARWRPRWLAPALGAALALNEIVWQSWKFSTEGWRFPEGLPVQMCDAALWLTVAAAITRKVWCYELAYFWGVAGASMAVITPDLWAPSWSYPTAYFFGAHGGLVMILLYLTWAGVARPRRGAWLRALAWGNGYAAAIGVFNALFLTNYMYLCRKPAGASLLDWFGPWPVYLLAGEALAAALFFLLSLPFRTRID